MADVDAVVCSPPYAGVALQPNEKSRPEAKIARLKAEGKFREAEVVRQHGSGTNSNLRQHDYGTTPGQLGALRAGEPDAGEGADVDVPTLDWAGCYARGWGRDVLVPAAMSHPAKFARGLLTRLYDHGFERGWWARGSVIGDPFCGVCCGGIVAAYKGLRWVGVELEERFFTLGLANIALHRANWEALGDPVPVTICGDSRNFAALVAGCGAVLTSPPYAGSLEADGVANRIDFSKAKEGGKRATPARKASGEGYGTTPGQLGALPAGDVGAVVTSPPWSAQMHEGGDTPAARGVGRNGRDQRPCEARGEHNPTRVYGDAEGQVGRESGETYFSACKQIYLECLKCLKPGGVLACVVKGYVRHGALVDLPGQTLRLLCSLGFEPVEVIRAWLTEERREAGLFGEVVTTKSRASFFRRLAEKRGAPPIRWEEVLVVRKGG